MTKELDPSEPNLHIGHRRLLLWLVMGLRYLLVLQIRHELLEELLLRVLTVKRLLAALRGR